MTIDIATIDGTTTQIAYPDEPMRAPTTKLRFATWSGSAAPLTKPLISDIKSDSVSVAVNSAGAPRIAYIEHDTTLQTDTLFLVDKAGAKSSLSTWSTGSGASLFRTRMVRGPGGKLHIAYTRYKAGVGHQLGYVCVP